MIPCKEVALIRGLFYYDPAVTGRLECSLQYPLVHPAIFGH
jgi:hypothetical protein